MSKMGQELDRKLDENKYVMYEACKKLVEWDASNDDARLISEACSFARVALAKVEGKL